MGGPNPEEKGRPKLPINRGSGDAPDRRGKGTKGGEDDDGVGVAPGNETGKRSLGGEEFHRLILWRIGRGDEQG